MIDKPKYNTKGTKELSEFEEFRKMGLNLWLVKLSTILGSFPITHDPTEAKEDDKELWAVTKEAEKTMKAQLDEKVTTNQELATVSFTLSICI